MNKKSIKKFLKKNKINYKSKQKIYDKFDIIIKIKIGGSHE